MNMTTITRDIAFTDKGADLTPDTLSATTSSPAIPVSGNDSHQTAASVPPRRVPKGKPSNITPEQRERVQKETGKHRSELKKMEEAFAGVDISREIHNTSPMSEPVAGVQAIDISEEELLAEYVFPGAICFPFCPRS
jgi:hypothetical protein